MRKARLLALLAIGFGAVVVAPAPSGAVLATNMPYVSVPENAGGYNSTSLTITGTADPFATVRVVLGTPPCPPTGCHDGPVLGTFATGLTGDFMIPATFSEGQHRIYVFANNGFTDSIPLARDFLIDTTAPAPPAITQPLGGELFTTRVVQLAGTAEPRAHVVLVDEVGGVRSTTALADGTWSYTALFTNGPHTVAAYQDDLAFNPSPLSGSVSFTVDIDVTPPPAPDIVTPAQDALTASAVTVAGTAEPFSTVEVYEDRPPGFKIYGTAAADMNGDWSLDVEFLDGLHFIRARATDASGNLGPSSAIRSWLVDAIRPTARVYLTPNYLFAAPFFSGDSVNGEARDNYGVASIEVTYFDMAGTPVQTNVASCVECVGTYVRWTDTPAGLAPGFHAVEAVAVDQVGNRSFAGSTNIFVIA